MRRPAGVSMPSVAVPVETRMVEAVAARSFGRCDQERFARLSGDRNPMHMDAVAARRTQAGECAVHGMHLLLWSLDQLADNGCPLARLVGAKVKFSSFVGLGQPVMLEVLSREAASLRLEAAANDEPVMTARLDFLQRSDSPCPAVPTRETSATVVGSTPLSPEFDGMEGLSGRLVPPDGASEHALAMFPALCRTLGVDVVRDLALVSTVVGMVVPGLHSILAEVAFRLRDAEGSLPGTVFAVTRTDARFRRVEIGTGGARIAAAVKAFARLPPAPVPTLEQAAACVTPGEFRERNAMVIGGSRGIGAATAKLIAAGGGTVTLSYVESRREAEAVAQDIRRGCGRDACAVFRYDAATEAEPQLAALPGRFTHVYYFATPRIFGSSKAVYAAARFAEFARIYIDGFYGLIAALVKRPDAPALTAFYPSSIAVAERPRHMCEYSMAKAAGEILCAEMMRSVPGLSISTPRLPRIATDQTATVPPVAAAGALEFMLPLLRHERG